jgi:ketosteroid isomerase-like protein
MLRFALFTLLAFAPIAAQAQSGNTLEAQAKAVLQRYVDAERDFDPGALAAVVSEHYIEVSPLGEADEHDRFLGFYAPANKVTTPPMTLTEDHFAEFDHGEGGVYVGTMVWHIPGADGTVKDMPLRVTWVFGKEDGVLKIQSAQYTPIRTKK